MRSMITDFNNSLRDDSAIKSTLNSDRMIQNEDLKNIYFETSFNELLGSLDQSIYKSFSDKDKIDTILFSIYVVLLFILYFLIWNKFLEMTKYSLWVTKSMLSIIPLEIIEKVQKIKDFLLSTSGASLSFKE